MLFIFIFIYTHQVAAKNLVDMSSNYVLIIIILCVPYLYGGSHHGCKNKLFTYQDTSLRCGEISLYLLCSFVIFVIIQVAESKTPGVKVEDLKENAEYKLRVKAVNKAGESKPAEVTTPVKTTKKQRKPKIDARHWNDIVKKIGQNFELECKYTGVPEPSIAWERIDDVSTIRLITQFTEWTITV